MSIDKKFVDQFIDVTSKAALASSYLVGKKNKIAADKAAVDSMRSELNKINIKGEIVIGEGELDEAPMLYIGEKLGTNNGPEFDIAVDPLEGTNFAANNLPGALSVIAIAEKNNLFKAPETYMEKISTKVNENTFVLFNPPYGERLKLNQLNFYEDIGTFFIVQTGDSDEATNTIEENILFKSEKDAINLARYIVDHE